jgi:hypothetical protein
VNVKPARRRLALVAKQPSQQAQLARRLVARQPFLEGCERLGGVGLRGIGLDRAGGDEGLVLNMERGRRGGQHGPLYGLRRAKIASRELVLGVCKYSAAYEACSPDEA